MVSKDSIDTADNHNNAGGKVNDVDWLIILFIKLFIIKRKKYKNKAQIISPEFKIISNR